MKRLCFGTFIDVLMQCRKQTLSKTKLTVAVIGTIDPNNAYDESNKLRGLNRLYRCDGDFVSTDSNIKELARKIDRVDLVKRLAEDVIPLIDIDKYELAVLALCDIIKNDSTLHRESDGSNVKKFKCYFGKEIEDLINTTEYILSEFLTDILRYTVIEIDNTVAKEWIKSVSPDGKAYDKFFEEYVESFSNKRNSIQVWADNTQKKESPISLPQNINQNPSTNLSDSESDCQCFTLSEVIYTEPQYHLCAGCQYFKGVSSTKDNIQNNLKGRCLLLDSFVMSKDGTNCEHFLANLAKVAIIRALDRFPYLYPHF